MAVDYAQTSSEKKSLLVSLVLGLILLLQWMAGLFFTPVDIHQGEVYRIIYLHVPAAFTAFFCGFLLFFFSVQGLRNKQEVTLLRGVAAAEVGLLFTIITLATGSIWGKPTWGVWWTWDARLTTTFILALLYMGYLILFRSLQAGQQRTTACAIMGLIIFFDIPIIYKSVTWWRTLHQPQTILRPGGGSATMDPEMLRVLVAGLIIMICSSIWLTIQRSKNLELADELEIRSMDNKV